MNRRNDCIGKKAIYIIPICIFEYIYNEELCLQMNY